MITTQLKLRNPALLKAACFIHGDWRSCDGPRISVRDPASDTVIAELGGCTRQDVLDAIAAASQAFPKWKRTTATERSQTLMRWHQLIIDNQEDLARILTLEQGKPLTESKLEVQYAASFIEWFAEEGKRAYGEITPSPWPDKKILSFREPVGVCAAITPWNFPYAMVTRKVAPAMAAGCTMVLKPSELTPLSALALTHLAEQAGFLRGCLNVVVGDPLEIGDTLMADPRVRKVSFTGSTRVGKILIEKSAKTVKKLSLELGGNAPFIVFDDADLEHAIDELLTAKFRNAGQACVAANRVYVQRGVLDDFTARLTQAVSGLSLGNGFDPIDIGPLINPEAVEKLERALEDAIAQGALIKYGGKPSSAPGYFFDPTILSNVRDDMAVAQRENFGPLVPLLSFDSEEEVYARANATESGLGAYVFTRSHNRIWRSLEELDAGMVAINSGYLSSAVAPFGGIKESGYGREGSSHGLAEYLNIKYASISTQ